MPKRQLTAADAIVLRPTRQYLLGYQGGVVIIKRFWSESTHSRGGGWLCERWLRSNRTRTF